MASSVLHHRRPVGGAPLLAVQPPAAPTAAAGQGDPDLRRWRGDDDSVMTAACWPGVSPSPFSTSGEVKEGELQRHAGDTVGETIRDAIRARLQPMGDGAQGSASGARAAQGGLLSVPDFDAAINEVITTLTKDNPTAAGRPLAQQYRSFCTTLSGFTARERAHVLRQGIAATTVTAPPREGARVDLWDFLKRVRSIMTGHIFAPPHTKPAHPRGVGAVVRVVASADAPACYQGVEEAVIRLGFGTEDGLPGLAVRFLAGGGSEPNAEPARDFNRLFIARGGDYNRPLYTSILGLTTRGPEGELRFEPTAIRRFDGGASWITNAAKLNLPGRCLGTLRPHTRGARDWTVELILAEQLLSYSWLLERVMRFPQRRGFSSWSSMAAWSVGAPLMLLGGTLGALGYGGWRAAQAIRNCVAQLRRAD